MGASRSRAVSALLAGVIWLSAAVAHPQGLVVTYLDPAETGFFDTTPTTSPITGRPSTLGVDRQAAFGFALQVWARYLDLNVDVTIEARFISMGGNALSAPLATAGPNTVERNFVGAPRSDTWYTIAQANQIAGSDGNPHHADINAFFNADLDGPIVLGDTGWYYGTDGQPGDDVDFVGVALHELCHGLGFVAMVRSNGSWYLGYQDIFSVQLCDRGAIGLDFTEMTPEQRAAAQVSGAVYWKGRAVVAANEGLARMYAPDPFVFGSSVSHWDTSHFPNLLLEPFYNEPFLALTLEWEALADLGWPLRPGEDMIVAWGSNGSGQVMVPAPNAGFVAIAGGARHSLGLKAHGSIIAWGKNDFGLADVPEPNADFVAVAAGADHTLGLRSSGAVVAWGSNALGQCDVPEPNAGFTGVAAGGAFSLGLRQDGSIAVWGDNRSGEGSVPEPNAGFVAVAAGRAHALGLRADGSVAAWGLSDDGQCAVPPPNTGFVAVAAGGYHSLGLRADGSVAAWGRNLEGQCEVPAPNVDFVALAAGEYHSVALRSSGAVVTWGSNAYGQCDVPPPNGSFTTVAAGQSHTLAIRAIPPLAISEPPPPDRGAEGGPPPAPAIVAVAPNPFNPRTTVWYDVPDAGVVALRIYDARGRLVRTLVNQNLTAGRHQITWDGREESGAASAAGLYLIRLVTADGRSRAAKAILTR